MTCDIMMRSAATIMTPWRTQMQQNPLQLRLAEITEMIHAASLFHDDVIDEADTRRGVPSVNKVFGNKLAILAGKLPIVSPDSSTLPSNFFAGYVCGMQSVSRVNFADFRQLDDVLPWHVKAALVIWPTRCGTNFRLVGDVRLQRRAALDGVLWCVACALFPRMSCRLPRWSESISARLPC